MQSHATTFKHVMSKKFSLIQLESDSACFIEMLAT